MTRHAFLIAPIALLLAPAAVVIGGCGGPGGSPPAAPQAARAPAASGESREIRLMPDSPQLARITLARVMTAPVAQDEVVAPGAIEAIPTRISRLAMPVAGRVTRVLVGLGDRVTRGQPVVAIDSPDAATMLSGAAQAEARVRQMQAALTKAQTDAARAHDLFEHKAAAQKDVEAADTQLAQARGDLDQAHAQREENQHHLAIVGLAPGSSREILLRAAVTGKVITIDVSPGEYRSDTAAALMTIADLAMVHVAADVPESQIRLIAQGEHVLVTLTAYPGEKFDAKVTRVGDTVDPKTRSVKVLAELPNPASRLRPGMFGRIEHTKTMRETPVVPASAVVQTEEQSLAVREKGQGVFEIVRVECGARIADNRIPILKGLQVGDRVVVDGTLLISGPATP